MNSVGCLIFYTGPNPPKSLSIFLCSYAGFAPICSPLLTTPRRTTSNPSSGGFGFSFFTRYPWSLTQILFSPLRLVIYDAAKSLTLTRSFHQSEFHPEQPPVVIAPHPSAAICASSRSSPC